MRPMLTRVVVCGLLSSLSVAKGAAQDRVPAKGGDVVITPFAHASVQVEHGGRVIHVDPWSVSDLSKARPADLILVTDADAGAHHLDPAAIRRLRKPGAPVVVPAAGKETLADGIVLANGERRTFGDLDVEAIAAYDLTPGDPYHPKGEANGYVLTVGGVRLYFVGVTECVPEIRAVKNINVMFVPMNLPNGRMAPAAAAECVRALRPRVAYPYHYDQGYIRRRADPAKAASPPEILKSLDELTALLTPAGVEVRRGPWYPAP